MVEIDYSSDSSGEIEIREWIMQELRNEVYSLADATPDGVNRDGEERYMSWEYPGNWKVCLCGNDAPQYTCWEPGEHFGRRYYGCKNWCKRRGAYLYCTYFEWEDPPLDERSVDVIKQSSEEIKCLTESQSSPAATVPQASSGSDKIIFVCFTPFCVGVCLAIFAGIMFKLLT